MALAAATTENCWKSSSNPAADQRDHPLGTGAQGMQPPCPSRPLLTRNSSATARNDSQKPAASTAHGSITSTTPGATASTGRTPSRAAGRRPVPHSRACRACWAGTPQPASRQSPALRRSPPSPPPAGPASKARAGDATPDRPTPAANRGRHHRHVQPADRHQMGEMPVVANTFHNAGGIAR